LLTIGVAWFSASEARGTCYKGGVSIEAIAGFGATVVFLAAAVFASVMILDESRRRYSAIISPEGLQLVSTGMLGRRNKIWLRNQIAGFRINHRMHHTLPELLLIEMSNRTFSVIDDLPLENLMLLEQSVRKVLE